MKSSSIKPKNFSERMILWSFILIYPIYFAGMTYPFRVLMPWGLLMVFGIAKCIIKFSWKSPTGLQLTSYLDNQFPSNQNSKGIPLLVWLWLISMIFMGVVKTIGLIDYGYDLNEILRSFLSWLGTWGLIGVAPFLGYLLAVRAELLYRGACIIALQSLLLTPFSYAAYVLKFSENLYLSPLERLFQNGPIYYIVSFYIRDVDTGGVRLCLFTPWAPALGLMGGLFLVLCLQEKQSVWRWLGVIGSLTMIITSVSRGMLLSLPIIFLTVWILEKLSFLNLQVLTGILFFLFGTSSSFIFNQIGSLLGDLKSTRESSSKVRDKLGELALEQWTESPIWGHGKMVDGPPSVKKMPIGSHHTWIGLLFTQGFLGVLALLIPSVITIGWLVLSLKRPAIQLYAKVTLTLFLIILSGSFVDNIESMAYLYWPALMMIGITLRANLD